MAEADGLNKYIFITRPYGKYKKYTSVKRTIDKMLFPGRRRTTDMSHVDGVDDGVEYGVKGTSVNFRGVYGLSSGGDGVTGHSVGIHGVFGYSEVGMGIRGLTRSGNGAVGHSDSGNGVDGVSNSGFGVHGYSILGLGVYGEGRNSYGVYGSSDGSYGVVGTSNRVGVYGSSYDGFGVSGASHNNYGVYAYSSQGYGLYASSYEGYAAYLKGEVNIHGPVHISGPLYMHGPIYKSGGSFRIDHPLDPADKYLYHSFVESPDMKNVYDGVVALDYNGEAEIELPDWFGALNKDFRYQLTAIGAPGPNLYIAEEISDGVTNYSNSNYNSSCFKIAGGTSGMKVSWQVTGIRKDPWANANRIEVEEDKPDKERGYYTHPELYGEPTEKGISRLLFPEEEKWQEQLIK
jgi:hypothetical protein